MMFLVPIGMYFVWRVWLLVRGQPWKPTGRWDYRTDAMWEYMKATRRPVTRRDVILIVVTVTVELSLMGAFVLWVVRERS